MTSEQDIAQGHKESSQINLADSAPADDTGWITTAVSRCPTAFFRELPSSPSAQGQFASLQTILAELSQEAARTEHNLHPTTLEEMELEEALQEFVKGWSKSTGITFSFDAQLDEDTFSPAIRTVIYRIAQESLTNIYKHAQATYSLIFNHREDETRERVELLDGFWKIGLNPSRGTAIFVRPLLPRREDS